MLLSRSTNEIKSQIKLIRNKQAACPHISQEKNSTVATFSMNIYLVKSGQWIFIVYYHDINFPNWSDC